MVHVATRTVANGNKRVNVLSTQQNIYLHMLKYPVNQDRKRQGKVKLSNV